MPQQQKALILPEKHGKFVVGNRSVPIPAGKEVLVKVTAAAINPLDWKIQDYGMFITDFPTVLGLEGSGVVEAVGPEVTAYKPGDRIFYKGQLQPDKGTFQQYTLVDTEFASKIPENISDDQAATIPIGSATAVSGLFQKSGIPFPENGPTASGKPVLILGGSSSVGQYAIQLARIAGFSPIVTTSSAQHAEYLKALGATHVFGRDVDVKTIQSAFPTPVGLVFDTISITSTQSLAFDVLSTPPLPTSAHLSLLLPLDESIKQKNEGEKVAVNQVIGGSQAFVPFWRVVGQWIKEGKYKPNRVQVVGGGLPGIPDALDLSRKGVSGVKLIVHPQE